MPVGDCCRDGQTALSVLRPVHAAAGAVHGGQAWMAGGIAYALSVIPVAGACLLLFHQPMGTLAVWWAVCLSWLGVVVAFYAVAPALGLRGVCFGGMVFIAVHAVSWLVCDEYLKHFGAMHSWSDDYFYLIQARLFDDILSLVGGSWREAWDLFIQEWEMEWSLSAWPIVLGQVAWFHRENLDLVLAVAVTLNAGFLGICLALMYAFLGEVARRAPLALFVCFCLVAEEMILFAGSSRKDMLTTLAVLLSVVSVPRIARRERAVRWMLALAAAVIVLLGTRPAYLVVPALAGFLMAMERWRVRPAVAVMILLGLAAAALGLEAVQNIQLRHLSVSFWLRMGAAEFREQTGWGATIYNVPLLGPVLYYIIAPMPINPFAIRQYEMFRLEILRSVGSALYVAVFVYVVVRLARRPALSPTLLISLAVYAALFASAVFFSDEARYKAPGNPFLAMVVFLLWSAGLSHGQAGSVRAGRGGNGPISAEAGHGLPVPR